MFRVGSTWLAWSFGALGCTASAVSGGVGGAGDTTSASGQQGTPTGSGVSGSAGSFTSASSATGTPSSTSTLTGGNGSASSSAAQGSSSSGPIPCVPANCSDAVPCTIDTCNPDGTCSHDPRAPGMPGDLAEGPCEGVCQTDATCGLALYQRDLGNPTWTKQALSSTWNGANAPPPRGIRAADGGLSFDLVVIADDNQLYERIGGAWVAPVSVPGTLGVDASEIDSLANFNFDGSESLQISLTQGGVHRFLFASISGSAISAGAPSDAAESPGFPAASQRLDWQAMIQSPSEGLLQWYRFEDGNVYRWNNTGFNAATPEVASDAWGDPATAPQPGTVRAALIVGNQIQFVAP